MNISLKKLAFIIPFFTLVLFSNKHLFASTQTSANDNFISTSAKVRFDKSTIQSIIDDYSYINYSKDYLRPLDASVTKFKTIELINPLGITSGCGTVDINFDETLTILLKAFQQTLEVLPPFLIKNSFGFPDISNPKAIFEFIYDTTTSLVCSGESVATATAEQAFNYPFAELFNKNNMGTDEDEQVVSAGQKMKCSAIAADKDKDKKSSNTQKPKNAEDKTKGQGNVETTNEYSENFKKCKAKYEDYKSFVNAKIAKIKLLEEKNIKTLKSSCDVLQKEMMLDAKKPSSDRMGNSKTVTFSPVYLSELKSHKVVSKNRGIQGTIVLNKDGTLESEVIIDRERQKKETEVFVEPKPMPIYIDSSLDLTVFKLGSEYQRLLDICTSPKSMEHTITDLTAQKKDDFNFTDSDFEIYKQTCDFLNNNNSPFPLQLADPNKPSADYTQRLLSKKAICDLTWFNIENDQFIVDSIGYATMALDKVRFNAPGSNSIQIQSPTIPELRAATRRIILEDFCEKKLILDIQRLDVAFEKKTDTDMMLTSRDANGLYIKGLSWRINKVYVPTAFELPTPFASGNTSPIVSTKIHTICEKHSNQTDYHVAFVDDTNPLTNVNIVKIPANNLTQLSSTLGFTDLKSSLFESLIPTKYETELLCDKKPGKSSCSPDKLSCSINWENKSNTRKDTLFSNPKSTNKDESGALNKIGDYEAYEKRKNEMDKISAPSQSDFEKDVLDGRQKLADNKVNVFNDMLINNYLFIDLREIEYQHRLNNLRF